MDTPQQTIGTNEILQVLNAIHAEQLRQGKHLRNIYQIQLILFAVILIGFTVALMTQLT